jgi:hypothetical protein
VGQDSRNRCNLRQVPSAEAVMQFIKKESLMAQPEPPAEPKIVEPLLSVLGRALQRNQPAGK